MNETIKFFLEENGYTCTVDGPLFYSYSRCLNNTVYRLDIDFEGAFALWIGGVEVLRCHAALDDHTFMVLLSSLRAASLSFLTKSLTA